MSNETKQELFNFLDQEFNISALQSEMHEIDYIINKGLSLPELEADRWEWASRTFPEATAVSSLRKLEGEIKEVENDLITGKDPAEEYADCLMCLLDSARRAGVTVEALLIAFRQKTQKNKMRVWVKNPDDSYSHIKQ